jgi:hypothetical protein
VDRAWRDLRPSAPLRRPPIDGPPAPGSPSGTASRRQDASRGRTHRARKP